MTGWMNLAYQGRLKVREISGTWEQPVKWSETKRKAMSVMEGPPTEMNSLGVDLYGADTSIPTHSI